MLLGISVSPNSNLPGTPQLMYAAPDIGIPIPIPGVRRCTFRCRSRTRTSSDRSCPHSRIVSGFSR